MVKLAAGARGDPRPVTVRTEVRDGARVADLRFTVGTTDVEAFLVSPADRGGSTPPPPAGILWWHWLDSEAPDGNRTEFLEEAVSWAARSRVVSLLPQGTYPWRVQPSGATADQAEVQAEVERFRAGIDLLAGTVGESRSRFAVVGHDFGAMIAMLALAEDPRPRGLVAIAATPRWGDWMLPFWPLPDDRIDYLRALRPLDPIERIGAIAPRPILLQHGERDFYVARMAGFELRRAGGEATELRFYDTEHNLDSESARQDRQVFLERLLELD